MTEVLNCSTIGFVRRALLVLSALLLVWAAVVFATGGVQWRIAGISLRSRDVWRPLTFALIAFTLHAAFFFDVFTRDVECVSTLLRRRAAIIAGGCAIVLVLIATKYGTFTASGADSYGYISQAYAWARGELPRARPLPLSFPWPSSDASLAPLGYRPGLQPHTIVPTYAPGLPLMMAAATLAGPCGPFLVVPLCAALLVGVTYALGRRAGGPTVGFVAAIMIVSSPIVLFQSLWPMSDVPAAAFWTSAIFAALGSTRRSALAGGTFCAAGLLVRPNLPLLALVLLAHIASTAEGRGRWVRMALFAIPIAPVVLFVAALNSMWYGGPLHTGYGATGEIYSLENISPNLMRYTKWLWESQSPLALFALIPLIPRVRGDFNRPASRLLVAAFLATLLCYLPYAVFEEWWYLRFLLPAFPAFVVLASMGVIALGRRLPGPWSRVAVGFLLAGQVVFGIRFSIAHTMFGSLAEIERRYADAGTYASRALPENAIVLTVQHSGSMRYYGGRLTVRYDLIDKEWVPKAPAEIVRRGYKPYLLAEDWELPLVREQFGVAPGAPLPWPMVGRMRDRGGITIFDLSGSQAVAPPVALDNLQSPRCASPRVSGF